MIRILLLLGFIFYSFPSLAEIVTAKGKYMHGGEISTDEGCKLAKDRAKLKAQEKVLGQTISVEELEKCTQIDGKSNCERNQFFFSMFKGHISDLKELSPPKKTTGTLDTETVYFCEIEIKANVVPAKQITDPNFNFNVKLSEYNFKTGDNLSMEINFNKPMYFTIFQWQPYIEKDWQIHKLFPNEREEDNYIKSKKITLPYNAKYEVYFPEKVNKKNIDEYLIYLGSESNINWFDEYNNIYELISQFIDYKKGVKMEYKQYTIYK